MPYIGTSPSNGVRRVHTYTATASQTTFTGAGSEGATLSYKDTTFVDVFQNGVLFPFVVSTCFVFILCFILCFIIILVSFYLGYYS